MSDLFDDDAPSQRLANFTNRVKEQDAFARVLATPKGTRLPLLHFYGVGGIGKTWTLKKLQANAALLGLPAGFVDLEQLPSPTIGVQVQALATLRGQLSALAMPRFDLALAWYWRNSGFTSENPARALAGPAGKVADFIEAKADVSFLAAGLKAIYGAVVKDTALDRLITSVTDGQLYLKFERMRPDEILPKLARLFVMDVEEAPVPESIVDAHRGHMPKAVIFLDTFEHLRRGANRTADGIHERERWVRELHYPNSPVLIVTAGRDFLRWGEQVSDYKENAACLEQHLIGGLSREDATDFLNLCGIKEGPLQAAVLRVSLDTESEPEEGERGYHPFCLGLCADTIDNEKRLGSVIDPATFDMAPNDRVALAQRFLKSLASDAHELWVRKLAVPPRFDELAARQMFSEHRSVEQDAAWHILQRYSFIDRAEDHPGWFVFHSRMREALLETDSELPAKHGEWRTYWTTQVQTETGEFAGLAWFHRYRMEPDAAAKEWNTKCKERRRQLDMAGHSTLLDWWEQTAITTADRLSPGEAGYLNDIGVELWQATLGDRGANVRAAIACFTTALRVCTEDKFPQDWAMTQNNLGAAHADRPDGDRGANLRAAIACYSTALRVYTEAAFPQDWATTQNNLGNAHVGLPDGERGANLREAIACYSAALRVYTEAAFPQGWAMTQNNLGLAHANLPDGDRGANVRAAIACYSAALRVYTEAAFPQDWAMTQNNLGAAHAGRPDGDRGANLRAAIACYSAALRVYTEAAFPQDWAMTQNNLGNAHADLPDGERGTNLREAIRCYSAALRVYTEAAFPQNWAATQNNLGTALADRPDGERGTNLREAIRCYENALRVYTEAAFPKDFAATSFNLGLAWEELASLEVATVNLTRAAECFTSAVRGYRAVGLTQNADRAQRVLTQVREALAG